MTILERLRPYRGVLSGLSLLLLLAAVLPSVSPLQAQEQTSPPAEAPVDPASPEPADSMEQEIGTLEEESAVDGDQTQTTSSDESAEPASDDSVEEQATDDETTTGAAVKPDPCRVQRTPDEERIDQYRREIFETVCETAARFDSFFGNLRFDEEARRTHGRAALRLVWDEYEGYELDGELDVNVDFPNLDHRVNAFLGRENRDDFVAGVEDELGFLPAFFEREGRQEWLVGLGYRPVSSDRSSVDVDVGVEADTPLDPFVRTRGRYYWLMGNDTLLRARQTFYWTNQKGYGSGTRLDFERPLGERTLARWTGNVVFDDGTEGADWDSGITFYHGFSRDRAVSWFIGIDGETEKPVSIEDYGTRFTYRQRMLREWFFGEVVTGLTWPREDLDEEREMSFHIGFGFEIQFSGEDLGLGRRRAAPAEADDGS